MLKRALLPIGIGISAVAFASALQQQPVGPAATPATPTPALASDPAMASGIATWRRLQQSDNLPIGEYIAFMASWPGWPGEPAMRATVERRIDPLNLDAPAIARHFNRMPPRTNSGRARQALALAAVGRGTEALTVAKAAWAGGALPPQDETLLLGRFAAQITPQDHDARMEALLWQRATASAQRQLNFTTLARRPLHVARLAMQAKRPDTASLLAALPAEAARDPGYLVDRAIWLRDTGQSVAARMLLANRGPLVAPPYDVERWLDAQLLFAQQAARDNQSTYAFDIARRLDDIYPAGTDIRSRPLGERDPYTSLAFLGGQIAMDKLGRPREAIALFDRYAAAALNPQTRARGEYWAGRAAAAAGDNVTANARFIAAAGYPDQFYGQLALERLGRPLNNPPTTSAPVTPEERAAYRARPIVQAATLLGRQGVWSDQTLFLRTIAQASRNDLDYRLAADLAADLRRPDLAVMANRAARAAGANDFVATGFPRLTVPASQSSRWTIIHAITRQESQFDREATSRVGAKGLMQLMPPTAREQSGKIGLPYDFARLTSDPSYNMTLGSTFIQRMLDYYGGNHVLAVASYNAGPGNVNKWLRANGDPRTGQVDVLTWIEAIPLSETRGYVQRVLENAVVYDSIAPNPRYPAQNRLSAYLGKRTPG